MKIGTDEKHLIAAILVSFLVGWYSATHQFSWDDLWLFGMSITFGLFGVATSKRPISIVRIWYCIGLLILYFSLYYAHYVMGY